jgi:CHAT domain-containing protein
VFADPVFASNDVRIQGTLGPSGTGDPAKGQPGHPHNPLESINEQTLPRLKHTRDEAKGILALATPNQSVAMLDFKASKDAAEDPDLANYRVVHFATHGLIDFTHPELSGLMLSLYDEKGRPIDGFLRLNEIFNLRLPAQLVVLSACESGEGKLVKGEGLLGLTRGFMYAGAASLVVSHWEVDDAATPELMIRFYKRLLGTEQLHPAAALRAAQLSMMQESKWAHPYYWAPFAVEGDWR